MNVEQKRTKLALWGAGFRTGYLLECGLNKIVDVIFDNNKEKNGQYFCGIQVVYPNDPKQLKGYFIIISTCYDEIKEQLESYGMSEEADFISFQKYYTRDVPLRQVQKVLEELFLKNVQSEEFIIRVGSKEEYDNICSQHSDTIKYEKALNMLYKKIVGKHAGYFGYCEVCHQERDFLVDYSWTDGTEPAWRETLICPGCNCNSRTRFLIEYVRKFEKDSHIYIYEAITTAYKELKKIFLNIQGSEYLGKENKSGEIVDGIMHQDALNLSFQDSLFDYIISADVFEHVSDYKKAFSEAYRCIKQGGRLILSIPIFKEKEISTIRCIVNKEGKNEYLLPPVYHGNPISSDGSLVYTDFGWDIIKELKKAGFRDVYALVYFSKRKAYLGDLPVLFEAIK